VDQPLFKLDNVSFKQGKTPVLRGLDLVIRKGEKIAVIGPSGAGKTTLLKLLIDRCSVPYALVPQQYGLVSQLSLLHNIYMGQLDQRSFWSNLRTLVWPSVGVRDQINPLITQLGLVGLANKATGNLSGGQQQRAAIGRALFRDAALLFADEPVSAVDSTQAVELLDLMFRSRETVILVIHSVELALEKADRVLGLKQGQLFFDLKSTEVTSDHLARLYAP